MWCNFLKDVHRNLILDMIYPIEIMLCFVISLPIKNDGNFTAPSEANNRATNHHTITSVPLHIFLD